MKHTPTPWNNDSPHGAVNITASNGRLICSAGGYSDNFTPNVHETNEANAAHIVKCVNLHDELVGLASFVAARFRYSEPDAAQAAQSILDKIHGGDNA